MMAKNASMMISILILFSFLSFVQTQEWITYEKDKGFSKEFKDAPVENMKGLFQNCIQLRSFYFEGIDTSRVTDMSHMFDNACALRGISLKDFDTSNLRNISHMFEYCSSLSQVDMTNF